MDAPLQEHRWMNYYFSSMYWLPDIALMVKSITLSPAGNFSLSKIENVNRSREHFLQMVVGYHPGLVGRLLRAGPRVPDAREGGGPAQAVAGRRSPIQDQQRVARATVAALRSENICVCTGGIKRRVRESSSTSCFS